MKKSAACSVLSAESNIPPASSSYPLFRYSPAKGKPLISPRGVRRGLPFAALTKFFFIAISSLLLTGCGYHISGSAETEPGYQWHSLYREDVKTIAVPVFGNRTFYKHAEDQLTTAIDKQIEAFTPYKIAQREVADTILEGEIVRVHLRTISRDRIAAVPQEQMYTIMVNFRWRDLRTGKVLVERQNYEETASFYPTLAEDQWVGQQQAIERLADAIVGELEAEWGRDKPTTKPATSQPDATTNQALP